MQSYQRRSQTRQTLRTSHCRDNYSTSNYSRGSSRKKFLDVYSKKDDAKNQSHERNKLSSSMVSLPINFEDHRLIRSNSVHLSRSQAVLAHAPRNPEAIRPQYQSHTRTQSVPIKTIIIKEIIKPIPVSFSMIQSSNVNLQFQQNYRHSLPLKSMPLPNKSDILRIQQSRQASGSVTMFSNMPFQNIHHIREEPRTMYNYTPMNPSPQIINNMNRIPIQPARSNMASQPILKITNAFNQKEGRIFQSSGPQIMMKSQQISLDRVQSQPRRKMLSNQQYLRSQINLQDMVPKGQCQSLKMSKISDQSKSEKANEKDSIVQIRQAQEEDSKQNIQGKSRHCICSKLQSFSQCSQIKINKNQALMPKKNFVFV